MRPTLAGVFGAVLGLMPHVVHHVGWLAGAALIAGVGGTLVLAVVGAAAMVPMLLRLRRRFASWWAPGIALTGYALMFTLSATVVGPALRGGMDAPSPAPVPAQHTPGYGHHPR